MQTRPRRSASFPLLAAPALFALLLSSMAVLTPLPALATSEATVDPWQALSKLRGTLDASSPFVASFTQSWIPAGFTSGEEEQGQMAAHLPECLFWEYSDPYPKSFLLCEETAWAWNPGETTGTRHHVDGRDAPGLDFFLQSPEDLTERYEATARKQEGHLALTLIPKEPTEDVVRVELELDAATHHLRVLAYEDEEGSRTRFELSAYKPKQTIDDTKFQPPEDIVWEDQ